MSEIIDAQISQAKIAIKSLTGETISDDRAFSHVILRSVFKVDFADQVVTDGKDDGGIDFLFFDEEESKIILGQSKYTTTLSPESVVEEFQKMQSTINNFKIGRTGSYNDRIKQHLQNMLDRLDSLDNVEYHLFTTAPIDPDAALLKLEKSAPDFPTQSVVIYNGDAIEKAIIKDQEDLNTVKEDKIEIDKAKNFLEYSSKDSVGILCNVKSTSIIKLYNKYAGKGLFDLNIRRYIRNNMVDTGIKHTLDHDRDNFWFLNNGIIIACEEYIPDGNTIRLYNFSIVNGGQTTTLIGTYKGAAAEPFLIPCKIVSTKNNHKAATFFTKIAEASNSQKPIYPRDLKSNAPEMVRLAKWLKTEKIYVEIKRGLKPDFTPTYSIKNDELGQLILSFVYQRPGTSRSGKKEIFENNVIYSQLFKANYDQEKNKKRFILDLIDLKQRYDDVESKFKKQEWSKKKLSPENIEILKNGKQTIFAIFGMLYRLVNGMITEEDINSSPKILGDTSSFEYGPILSNYKADDLEEKLEQVVYDILAIITDAYKVAFKNGTATSVSNFMKTDPKYYDLAKESLTYFPMIIGEDLKSNWDIFKIDCSH